MRIRDFIKSYRSRRARQLSRVDSVSFEAFCNEIPPDKSLETKESSIDSNFTLSPTKSTEQDYTRFEPNTNQNKSCAVFYIGLVLFLSAMFLLFTVVYLLNCFNIMHNYQQFADNVNNNKRYMKHNRIETITKDVKKMSLPPPPKPDYAQCKIIPENERLDCYPTNGANVETCESRGCCWIPLKGNNPTGIPYCFYPQNFDTYKFINVTETSFGLITFLKRSYKSAYSKDVETLKMVVKYETDTRLHVKITDAMETRFEPPVPEVPIVDRAANNLSYIFDFDVIKAGFKVLRRSDKTIIFDSYNFLNFIYSNQFLQISTKLSSNYVYGLGEHRSRLLLSTNWSTFTMFNHDSVPTFNKNLYGSHPFYLNIEPKTGNANGVFLLNSNAMDVILQPTPAITYRTIGGILDFYFFLGPTPADVISQYSEITGKPHMPPYWSLGFHLCRFGYKTLNRTMQVMERNIRAGIPLDTQWNDLDYMNNSNDFTFDEVNFKGLGEFVKNLHKQGRHYVPLIDPGVSASEPPGTYEPWELGVKMDIFVKNSTDQIFIGKVWNHGTTAWPDFTNPTSVDYWTLLLKKMHGKVEFDGAWIDMNEPSNFLNGQFDGCPQSNLENPPYLPGVDGDVLNYKTICMTAKHYAGYHYDIHNVYGFTEAIMTSFAMAEIRGKRPMVISRSSFPGLGHYAGHWSGDVWSAWTDMKYTVPQLLTFALFNIPLMGADICGFNGNTTKELCQRWMQLGAFYPFSRNHNTDDGIDQDPVAMGDEVVESSKKALSIRYSLLPYLYTLFFKAHVYAETVARPLFFEFTNDTLTYDIDNQFLWGNSLMIVPVLEENTTQLTAYFPYGIWYDYYTKSNIKTQGNYVNITAPLDTIPLYIRGGYVIPSQEPKLTTTESRLSKINLLVAVDETGRAQGDLYWDDGDSLNSYEEKNYSLTEFNLDKSVLRMESKGSMLPPDLGSIEVLGVEEAVTKVEVNGISQGFKYDTVHKYLMIEKLDCSFKNPIVVTWN